MDGLILIDKPSNITSYDVIRKIKKNLNYNTKIGHAGTLDPLATGLLVILLGKATKLFDHFLKGSKIYSGSIRLGELYDSCDIDGNLLEKIDVDISSDLVYKTAMLFDNIEYLQTPPKYSAIKINGKKAYELARKNIDFEIKPKKVSIYSFKITKIENNEVFFETKVSKGTYIRTLAIDFCKKLNTIGSISSLRREMIDNLSIDMAYNIDNYKILDLKEYLEKNVEKIKLDDTMSRLVKNGIKLDKRFTSKLKGDVLITNNNNEVIAYYTKCDNYYCPVIIF